MNQYELIMRCLVIAIAVLVTGGNCLGQNPKPPPQQSKRVNSDPAAAQLVTSDIVLFWQAYDLAKPENNLIVYRDQYLRKGSAGLKDFTRTRISSSCDLVDVIEKHQKYYSALRDSFQEVY
jgi:hypothetical protein